MRTLPYLLLALLLGAGAAILGVIDALSRLS